MLFQMQFSNEQTDIYFRQYESHPATLACYFLILTLSLLCGLSREKCNFALATLRFIMRWLVVETNISSSSEEARLADLPRDSRTLLKRIHLDPKCKSYITCPSCFKLYNDDDFACPEYCIHSPLPGAPQCSTKLKRTRIIRGTAFEHPVKRYLYQDMKQWLARFLSRSDIESKLERGSAAMKVADGEQHDIWDAEVLQNFQGPDGSPFVCGPSKELRLVFSLGVDGFNPSGMKIGKGSASSTGIYMICLNLPVDLRYHPENMYLVGVLPGPNKPSLDQINEGLAPLVDDLLLAWDPGFFYTRTSLYPSGRPCRSAVIPLVCDIIGARQVGGFAGPTNTIFCSYCLLTKDRIEELPSNKWSMRSCKEHRAVAEKWRDAQTAEEQKAIVDRYGVRYSELLRLPYWNPVLFTVLDSMHADFLLKLHHHIRDVWGADPSMASGEGHHAPLPRPPRPSDSALASGLCVLIKGNMDKAHEQALLRCQKPVLYHLCHEFGLRRAQTALLMARELIQFVRHALYCYHDQQVQFLLLFHKRQPSENFAKIQKLLKTLSESKVFSCTR